LKAKALLSGSESGRGFSSVFRHHFNPAAARPRCAAGAGPPPGLDAPGRRAWRARHAWTLRLQACYRHAATGGYMDKLNRRDFIASSGAIAAAGVATGAARAAAPAGSPPPASGTPEPSFARRATPLRFNASIDDCEVVGKIPDDIDGAFYRVGYEWYYPPRFPDDAILNADGYISMFRIKDGKVHYRGRWIETYRLQQLRKAGRQLYGYYRNPYTDDPSVSDPARPNLRTVANTAPLVH